MTRDICKSGAAIVRTIMSHQEIARRTSSESTQRDPCSSLPRVPFMIPMMLMVVAVACIGMVMTSTKYDV